MRWSHRIPTFFAVLALGGILGGSPIFAMKSKPALPVAKQLVHDRGVGKSVKIKQVDGTSVRGKIASIGDDSFTMTVSDKTVEIPYARVSSVEGPGLPKAVTIIIVVVLVLTGLGIAGHFT